MYFVYPQVTILEVTGTKCYDGTTAGKTARMYVYTRVTWAGTADAAAVSVPAHPHKLWL